MASVANVEEKQSRAGETMALDITVTNAGPATTTQPHSASLDLSQRYTEQRYEPFEHQAEVFHPIGERRWGPSIHTVMD